MNDREVRDPSPANHDEPDHFFAAIRVDQVDDDEIRDHDKQNN